MTLDPYKLLGVKRSATKPQIRAAYRKLSKAAHPDTGGDAVTFARLRLAHDVLLDGERRAKFDATGEIEEGKADNAEAHVVTLLAAAFQSAILGIVQAGRDPNQVDVVAVMRAQIERRQRELVEGGVQLKADREKWCRMVGRFNSGKAPNHLETMVLGQIAGIDAKLRKADGEIAGLAKAAERLAGYTYRFDQPPPVVRSYSFGFGSASTSTV